MVDILPRRGKFYKGQSGDSKRLPEEIAKFHTLKRENILG